MICYVRRINSGAVRKKRQQRSASWDSRRSNRVQNSSGTPKKQMKMTPKRGKGSKKRHSARKGRRSISFGSESSYSEINDVSNQLEKARVFDSDDFKSPSSSVISTSSRGRQRAVPSYAEEDVVESADEFESKPPLTWGIDQPESPGTSQVTPLKTTKRRSIGKTRNLFEESDDDDSVQISEYDSAEEAFSPINQENGSGHRGRAVASSQLNISRSSVFTSSSESEPDEVYQTPMLTQNSRSATSIVNSASNPFGNILAKVRQNVNQPNCKRNSPEVQRKKVIVNHQAGGDMLTQASADPIELMDEIFTDESLPMAASLTETNEINDSPPETPSQPQSFNYSADSKQQIFDSFSESDDSEFGAFKNVVEDVMLNTSRMASQDGGSDSDGSSAFFM